MEDEAKNIVILHGWGGSSQSWNTVSQILREKGANVFVPDFPGFGTEGSPDSSWSVDDYLKWTLDYIASKGLKSFYLLGHSFGGRVSIKLAARHPEKIRGLILVSSAGIKRKLDLKQRAISLFSKCIPFAPERAKRFFYKHIVRRKDYFEAKRVMKETFKKVIAEDLSPCLQEIKVPTLLVWGEKDKMVPLEDGRIMNREIKNSQLEIIGGEGHAPNLTAPDKLSEIIIRFIWNNE